jgi:hypothetical protein
MSLKWTIGHRLTLPTCLVLVLAASAHAADISSYRASFFATSHPNTAYDMIRRLPGFVFDNGTDARGYAGTAGNVLIDGQRPTAKTDDLKSILQRIPATDVSRIEVISGNPRGINMEGHTVVADVIRKRSALTDLIASASTNIWIDGHTVNDLKLEYVHTEGNWRYEASIERFPNYDDAAGMGSNAVTIFPTSVTRQHLNYSSAAEGWNFNSAITMPLLKGHFRTNLTIQDSPNSSLLRYFSSTTTQQVLDDSHQNNIEFGTHWTRQWGNLFLSILSLQRLGQYTEINALYSPQNSQIFSTAQNTGESIFHAALRYDFFESISIEGGGEAVYNFLNSRSNYVENAIAISLPGSDADVSEQRGQAFLQLTWKFSTNMSLLAGSWFELSTIRERGNANQTRSFFYPKPRLVLSWTPDHKDQVRLRVQRKVGQLDFTDFSASSDLLASGVHAGNSQLRPDQHMQYELYFQRQFWKSGAVRLGLLHEDLKDVVDRVPIYANGEVYDAPGNLPSGQDNKIYVDGNMPLEKFGIRGGTLRLKSVFRFSSVEDPVTHEWRRISGERPYSIRVYFSQTLPRWHSTWGVDFDAGWDEYYYRVQSYEHRYMTPPYLQIHWQYNPAAAWSIQVEADNIVPFIFRQTVISYNGLRGSTAPAQITTLQINSQPRLFLQIRRTFG